MLTLTTSMPRKWTFIVGAIVLAACSDEVSSLAPADSGSSNPIDVRDASPVDAGRDAATDVVEAGVPLDVPQSLVAALGGKTYVDGTCEPTTYPGWPYPAKRCSYRNNLVVTIANPEPERVARWIVEASTLISALDALHTRDRASWEAGLVVIAKHTIGQSSRIFPLDGQVYEDGTAYVFERGVTKTCSSGCYCRINSTSRQQWCAYAATVLKTETEATCLEKYGQISKTLTEAWLAHCVANHEASWNSDSNEHYRAQAWNANKSIALKVPDPATASGDAVIVALKAEYP
jgi:hypothetical protein